MKLSGCFEVFAAIIGKLFFCFYALATRFATPCTAPAAAFVMAYPITCEVNSCSGSPKEVRAVPVCCDAYDPRVGGAAEVHAESAKLFG